VLFGTTRLLYALFEPFHLAVSDYLHKKDVIQVCASDVTSQLTDFSFLSLPGYAQKIMDIKWIEIFEALHLLTRMTVCGKDVLATAPSLANVYIKLVALMVSFVPLNCACNSHVSCISEIGMLLLQNLFEKAGISPIRPSGSADRLPDAARSPLPAPPLPAPLLQASPRCALPQYP
jgi:hypothetical protein